MVYFSFSEMPKLSPLKQQKEQFVLVTAREGGRGSSGYDIRWPECVLHPASRCPCHLPALSFPYLYQIYEFHGTIRRIN